jgi:hypothetical protein
LGSASANTCTGSLASCLPERGSSYNKLFVGLAQAATIPQTDKQKLTCAPDQVQPDQVKVQSTGISAIHLEISRKGEVRDREEKAAKNPQYTPSPETWIGQNMTLLKIFL